MNYEDFDGEEWRSVEGYDGLYEVSNFGRVKSLAREVLRGNRWGGTNNQKVPERILKNVNNPKHPCAYVSLCDGEGGVKKRYVGQLVLEAFVGPRPGPEYKAHHLNLDPTDCTLGNLEWGVTSELYKRVLENGGYIDDSGCFKSRRLDKNQAEFVKKAKGIVTQKELAEVFGCSKTSINRYQNER